MKIFKKKEAYKGKYLKVIEREYLNKFGKKGIWECIEKHNAVFIFPITKKKEVILEKIYRIPIKSFSIELPAGLLDKPKENPKKAAKRELLEETGYLAKKLIPILKFPIQPALATHWGFVFFAPEVEFISKINQDDAEEIEVLKIPINKLENFLIKQSKKTNIDIKILGFFALIKEKKLI